MAFFLVSGNTPAAAQATPNLTFTKSVTPGTATFGETFTFTLQLTNNDPVTITNAVLWDTFPVSLSITGVSTNNTNDSWAVNSGVVSINLAPLPPQGVETRKITINAKVNPNAVIGTYSNFANINIAGLVLQSNTVNYQIISNIPTPTPGIPTMVLEKTVSPVATGIGGIFTFSIQMTNNGTVSATDLTFEDSFPIVLNILSVTSTENEDVLVNTIAEINAMSPRFVQMRLISIPPTARRRITITAQVNNNARVSTNYANTAILSDSNNIWRSNNAAYQVLTDITLPPTGGMEIDRSGATWFGILLAAGISLAGLGGIALFLARKYKLREPQMAGRLVMGSAALLIVGLALSLAACTARAPTPATDPISPPAAHQEEPQVVLPAVSEVDGLVVVVPSDVPAMDPAQDAMDYPDPTPPAVAGSQDTSLDLSPVRRLVIPALGLDAPVRYIPFNGSTWRVDTLESQIAWLGDTGWPGLGGNIGLAGHVSLKDGSDGPFRNLDELKKGDLLEVYTSQKVYTFKINELAKVGGGDISVIAQSDDTRLTLITCADWDKTQQAYLSRLIVSSELVSVQPVTRTSSN
jgi:LPXTG-site transpeptidase (sortase) family protein